MKRKLGAILLVVALALALVLPAAPAAAHTEEEPQVVTLFAGQDIDVGTVSVWNDGTDLYVKYQTTGDWVITETHLEVVTDPDDFPQTKKGNPIPGHFTYSMEHNPAVTEYEEVISGFTAGFTAGDCVYIAAHAVVVRPVEGCWETVWQIGDVEGVDPASGLLYNYADEFNWGPVGATPTTAGPGLSVIEPPFTDPFIAGTTPLNQFPYNSNYGRGYATDFDVQWSGSLPFGGKLTVSWSPGQSANETKVVGDGISTTSFSATGTPRPGEGWFMDKYPLVEHEVSINPLSDGVHTINFQHTQGDGTFWDWIRLEKPCEQEETAWGDGTRFVEKGNWATYFCYCIQGTLWQIGTPDGNVGPIQGSSEFPVTGDTSVESSWVWVASQDYNIGYDEDPISLPSAYGYIGPDNVRAFTSDTRPPTDTTAELNIYFDLYCDYEAGDLVLYYDRYGSEQDNVWIDLHIDGATLLGSPSATEGGFQQFVYFLPAMDAGPHSISIVYVGGGSGNGHYIDYLKLVYE